MQIIKVSICMRMRHLLLLILVALFGDLTAQKPYFQQKVNYDIKATLDDSKKQLKGEVKLLYYNLSPDTLHEMYFHYWTNAYKNRSTAFAKQMLRNGDTKFYFTDEDNLGGYDEPAIYIDGQKQPWLYHEDNPDIVRIKLKTPIPPQRAAQITIPFTETIPAPFSRIGQGKNAYQMTQWYPKPAVYDRYGWHPIPYLNQGEFYSEFGDYKVELTLPENYVVAATGTLTTPSEVAFLENKTGETTAYLAKHSDNIADTTIPSSPKMKTIQYEAKNVHDFAWFANKGFMVAKSEATLRSSKKVATYAFFTRDQVKLWSKAVSYVDRAVLFYSEHVGEYPYEHATAVFGALDAGGGMEYPMITIIDQVPNAKALDIVITHEVGHNWFYGLLGSNERVHPWMDEGINSYYEKRYTDTYYKPDSVASNKKKSSFNLNTSDEMLELLAYKYQARYHYDQPSGIHADSFSSINYGLDLYKKTAWSMTMLENQLGTENFDKIMQQYFREWKFRHPHPADIRAVFDKGTSKDTKWFFDGMIAKTGRIDYTLASVVNDKQDVRLTVKNEGNVAAPFSVTAFRGGKPAYSQWFDGTDSTKTVSIINENYEYYRINDEKWSPELYLHDNARYANGKKMLKHGLNFLIGGEQKDKKNMYWLPAITFNDYDKWMLGVTLHNMDLPGKRFEYMITPMYGTYSKQLAGNANIQYSILSNKNNGRWHIGINARMYSLANNPGFDYFDRYTKIAPYIRYLFPYVPNTKIDQSIELRSTQLLFKSGAVSSDDGGNLSFGGYNNTHAMVNEITYRYNNPDEINPFRFKASVEHFDYQRISSANTSQIRAIVETGFSFKYMRGKSFDFRIWGGVMLYNSDKEGKDDIQNRNPGSLSLFGRGADDYKYDGLFFGRTNVEDFSSRQIMGDYNGGFKDAVSPQLPGGFSNRYAVSLNAKVALPITPAIFPLKPYFDIAYGDFAIAGPKDTKILWSGGLMLDYFGGIFRVYMPLVYNDEIKYLHNQTRDGNFGSRISFTLDLQKLNPILFKKDLNKMITF